MNKIEVPKRKPEHESQRSTSNRLLMGLLIITTILGNFFYWRQQFSQNSRPNKGYLKRESWSAPEMTPEQHAETIAKAELLRAKFRSWALQHKAVLASMLAAQPTDTAAQMAAWNSLPWKCSEAGILGTELCPSGEPFVGVTFSWNPVQSGPLDATIIAKLATQQQRVVSFMDRRIQELRQDRFIKQRDIVLSSSVSAAPTQINLWVSGRITEKTKLSDEDRAKMLSDLKASGKPLHEADLWGPDRAVMPPYEFLKSTITPKENTL